MSEPGHAAARVLVSLVPLAVVSQSCQRTVSGGSLPVLPLGSLNSVAASPQHVYHSIKMRSLQHLLYYLDGWYLLYRNWDSDDLLNALDL